MNSRGELPSADEESPEFLAERLQDARQRVADLVVMGLRPEQSPDRLRLLSQLERSARAEVQLRRKALQWSQQQTALSSQPAPQPKPVSPTATP
jgi:hypothetical protein